MTAKWVVLGIAIVLSRAHAAPPDTRLYLVNPVNFWDTIINRGGAKVDFGVSLQGPSPYTRHDDQVFIPASNAKLFTSGAALAYLGRDFRIETKLRWQVTGPGQASNLTLLGAGDPTWGMPKYGEADPAARLKTLAKGLHLQGIRAVVGPVTLVAADPRWEARRYPEGWTADDAANCYGALAQAFNVAGNCGTLVITGPRKAQWLEPGIAIPVTLDITKGSRTRLEVFSLDDATHVGAGFRVSGTWAAPARALRFRVPIQNTTPWVKALFEQALREAGIRLLPALAKEPTANAPYNELISPSVPLADLLKPFNKDSINHVGDALFAIMGSLHGNPKSPDLIAAGQGVLREFASHIGEAAATAVGTTVSPNFFKNDVTLWDGSGISRENGVTTSAVMALLLDLRQSPDFDVVWNALPIAGVDGTLSARMRGTAAAGVLRAKTGTLRGVYNLSGYVPRLRDGQVVEYVPFVMLTKTEAQYKSEARAAEDRVGAMLSELVNPPVRFRVVSKDAPRSR